MERWNVPKEDEKSRLKTGLCGVSKKKQRNKREYCLQTFFTILNTLLQSTDCSAGEYCSNEHREVNFSGKFEVSFFASLNDRLLCVKDSERLTDYAVKCSSLQEKYEIEKSFCF